MVMWVLLCCATVTTMSSAYAMHGTHTSPGLTCSTDVKSIETSHLILRPFTNDDVDYIFEHWTKDSDLTTQLGWTHPENIECVEHSTTTDTPHRIMYQITPTYQEFLDIES